jgi:hypothetical protein
MAAKEKCKKITHSEKCLIQSIPLKTASNGGELSLGGSTFEWGDCQLIARIDGIDRAFLFGIDQAFLFGIDRAFLFGNGWFARLTPFP